MFEVTEATTTGVASLEDVLAMDLLTLREHTTRAGDVLDAELHRQRLTASLSVSEFCSVRQDGRLVAYALFRPEHEGSGAGMHFVSGLCIHPAFRTPSIILELCRVMLDRLRACGVQCLRSNVYRTNARSVAFHRKLGFRVTRENDKGLEFTGSVDEIVASPTFRRMAARIAR